MSTAEQFITYRPTLTSQLLAITIAFAIAFGLFVFMAFLVKDDKKITFIDVAFPVINVAQTPPESKVFEKDKLKLTPPPQPKPMPRENIVPDPVSTDNGLSYQPKGIAITQVVTQVGASFKRADADARPIVRVNPKYPIDAAREGKEGWVVLSFTINEIGAVTDIKIVNSEPKRIFDKAAKQALRKWKYRPKSVNGKTIKQENLTVQLDFTLNDKQGS